MRHQIRFTLEKISLRLKEIEGLVYHQREPLPLFSYLKINNPGLSPDEVNQVEGDWQTISLFILPVIHHLYTYR